MARRWGRWFLNGLLVYFLFIFPSSVGGFLRKWWVSFDCLFGFSFVVLVVFCNFHAAAIYKWPSIVSGESKTYHISI
ncbi:hypothetical protein ERO13_A10G215080v2 [Gossypium hirsutum]|nr:hypothetical protein ERO13_A10G215080v2 [Gossypium hirsutum]